MFAARYAAMLDHLQQALAILGPPEPVNAEIDSALRNAIRIVSVRLFDEMVWSEANADDKIVRVEREVPPAD